jgi:hypothetical protein
VNGSGFACFDRSAAVAGRLSQTTDSEPFSFDPEAAITREKTTLAAKSARSSSAREGGKTHHALNQKMAKPVAVAVAAAVEPPSIAPQPEAIDPVVDRAKIAVGVKLENPASATFSEMNRSMRKNTLGQSVDTICGHVKGKKASGEDIGDRPFLYLVKADEAYIADGSPSSEASTAYRNICN